LGWASGFAPTFPDNADMAKLGGSKTEANLKTFAGKVRQSGASDIALRAGNSDQVL